MISHRIANSSARTRQLGQSGRYLLCSYSAAGAAISYSIANSSARTRRLGQSDRYLLSSYSAAGAAISCSIRYFVQYS